jgi:dienelactone hydrolase
MKRGWIALALLAAALGAQARLAEEEIDLPVRVVDGFGKAIEQAIKVTVFSDDTNPRPAPVLVLNHGRAPDPEGRAALGRARYGDAARWLVSRGFIVAVPTRIGYGVTGGEDIEDSGGCAHKNYAPGYSAAAQQTLAVLQAMRKRPDAAPDRAVVMGQSYGGTTAVTIAALNPPGVQATINFAGGGGGNPKTQPQRPCAPQSLERLFKGYGEQAKVPVLWVYTENDMYFGPRYPREWFAAYRAAGGPGEFVQFPPHGDDGHLMFSRFPQVWQPKVAQFLDAQGFKAPWKIKFPAAAGVPLDDEGRLPYVKDTGRAGYRTFLTKAGPRAFAVAPNGSWGWANGGDEPLARALANCNRSGGGACKVYAIDHEVVWKAE